MHILLTNDDGIQADTLWQLHEAIKDFADITVIAPDSERSGVGHAITYREPVQIETVKEEGDGVYQLTGTPADCVKFGLFNILDDPPDLVVSGINPGLNLGCNVFYSGTVAAAIEGVMHGVCSIAVSCDPGGLAQIGSLARQAAETIQSLFKKSGPGAIAFNVNLPQPAMKDPELVFTHHHAQAFEERYVQTETSNSFHLDLPYGQLSSMKQPCDVTAIQNGNISVTPLQASLTNHNLLDELRS